MSDYPDGLDVRPLTTWPGPLTEDRVRSPFSATMSSTLHTLSSELWHLSAEHSVLEIAIPAHMFRVDGRPRSRAVADHPGVVLSLPSTDVGPLRYACDRFWTWQDNLRAIALGLEALRKVERYGITKRGEQYVGFRALPAGRGDQSGMTATDAADVILRAAHLPFADELAHSRAFWTDRGAIILRAARRAVHPDRNAGDTAQWHLVDNAEQTLRRAGWLPAALSAGVVYD